MADSGLEPPKDIKSVDPGAHQLAESSDSDDQFTDAQSAQSAPSPMMNSPIPKTRVEKIDDEPSHGEVSGTEAYKMREGDAKPDEIAMAPEDSPARSRSTTLQSAIPATLVEESAGNAPGRHSAAFEEKRKADASPDAVVDAEGEIKEIQGTSISDAPKSPTLESSTQQSPPVEASNDSPSSPSPPPPEQPVAPLPPPVQDDYNDDDVDDGDGENKDDDSFRKAVEAKNKNDGDDFGGVAEAEDGGEGDDFGDDFDDFEEGGGDDDGFDDFGDGFQEAEPSPPPPSIPTQQPSTLPFPIPDFDGLDSDEVISATDPYLANLFPAGDIDLPALPPLSQEASIFLTPRSASLWSQLVAPPPLAPPDWIRSRIRRLFLVSLGVPVDLDEILPASKQKKLVLPSLNVPTTSSRTSSDSRSGSRLKQGEGNNSSTSVDTQGRPSSSLKRRKGPPPEPELDLVAARHLCMTTDEALDGMTDEELKAHVAKLEAMEGLAKDALEHWQKRTDEKIGDREAFEGVIENLVKHARKVRK